MLYNLLNQMQRKNISMKKLANVMGVNEKTAYNKTRGKTPVTLNEALAIQKNIFPEKTLEFLFKNEKE